MRKWETLTALAAVVLASAGSVPQMPYRLAVTCVAVALIAIVGVSRVLAALKGKRNQSPSLDPAQRAKNIREARSKIRPGPP